MEVFINLKNLFLSVWDKGILGIDIGQILIGLGIFLIFLIFRGLISKLIIKKLELISKRTTNKLDYNKIKIYNYDAIIFTSSNAIRFLELKNINKNILCFCVGSSTEKTARSNGFQNVFAADGNVRNLKELIQQNLSEKDNKILYVSGDVVSYPLDKELISEGYNVERLINYTVKHNENLDLSFLESLKIDMPNLVYVYS